MKIVTFYTEFFSDKNIEKSLSWNEEIKAEKDELVSDKFAVIIGYFN